MLVSIVVCISGCGSRDDDFLNATAVRRGSLLRSVSRGGHGIAIDGGDVPRQAEDRRRVPPHRSAVKRITRALNEQLRRDDAARPAL